jgi:putative transposase
MTNTEGREGRRSLRLREYDYNQPGAYFITICTENRECLFGEIVGGEMKINEIGDSVRTTWQHIGTRYLHTAIDAFVIMPNHIHGIIFINVGAIHESPLQKSEITRRRNMLLPKIIGYFKMNSAKKITTLRATSGTPVWQRNYYEHVIRNEIELEEIREYIENNRAKWLEDENHPANIE